jgi:DeoR/GlpR family transcriptional regulator of sugar metabolism
VQELTQRLKVSEVTIRKDLTLLEEMGNVVRTRGGAQLAEDRAQLRGIQVRKEENLAEKERIAAKARELVNEDDTIYVDSGSTCMLFARRLLDMNLRIVTNSLDIMNVVADAPGISLISVGGSYRKEAGSFIGPMAIEALKGLRIQTCFIGATALSAAGVFSSQNIIEAELKSRVLKSSKRRVVLADAGKFGRDAFAVFARPEDVDILITDRWIEGMRDLTVLGIEVLAAGA